jgi:hypothetical protein
LIKWVDYYPCEGIDAVLIFKCPPANKMFLNLVSYATLRVGDRASSLGFLDGDDFKSRFWTGHLSGKIEKELKSHDGTVFHKDEYLIEGSTQMLGMSGGAALNGFGYTGMAHMYSMENISMASVIPASLILQCFDQIDQRSKRKFMGRMIGCKRPFINIPQK